MRKPNIKMRRHLLQTSYISHSGVGKMSNIYTRKDIFLKNHYKSHSGKREGG